MSLVAFGRPAEKLVFASIIKLATLQSIDRMTLPGPFKALINLQKFFTIGLTNRGIKTRFGNYKIFDSTDLKDQEWHTVIVAPTSKSSTFPPLTLGSLASRATIEEPEKQLLPTPIKTEISREVFLVPTFEKQPVLTKGEESPSKKYKTRALPKATQQSKKTTAQDC
ncbi:PREDICTED: uncharacterized protein LOC108663403 [Theobroma cacao]|uniref:Uncharacterized protein LOC108663403 n=1 Tax=Theobroma cacao TaxID=3641 RepID=A0AB32WSY9_THECC|nr:PREDICTED: uncharacterized protein LOC108663403 [Theobroma cacao]